MSLKLLLGREESFTGAAIMDVVIIEDNSSAFVAHRKGEPFDECGLPLPTKNKCSFQTTKFM
jgi:hypothetical protein